jgi:mannose-1-phosphate guanylyltransferase
MRSDLHVVVLAGGSGTRFWPASRRVRPKQLLALAPGSRSTLLAEAVRRVLTLCPAERVWIATGEHLVRATEEALPDIGRDTILGEPLGRNTAPSIGWVTDIIRERDPDALVAVLPSDPYVADEAGYRAALERAIDAAQGGTIVTIGIEPTHPETGFGYIALGDEVAPGVHDAQAFVEKPSRERAERFVAEGKHLWNAGMFFFRAATMQAAIARCLPELARGLERLAALRQKGGDTHSELTRIFSELPAVSIDHGVMEKTRPIHVVPARFGWSDLGSWQAAWELGEKDAAENVADGEVVLVDARRNLVKSQGGGGRVIALLGVEDLCVVDTPDALLVMPRERAQDVRAVVEALKNAGHDDKL